MRPARVGAERLGGARRRDRRRRSGPRSRRPAPTSSTRTSDPDHHRSRLHAPRRRASARGRARRGGCAGAGAASTCSGTTACIRGWAASTSCRSSRSRVAMRTGARRRALPVARRVGDELGLPVFLYGEVASGRRPAFFRRGGLDELQRRVTAGELVPAYGPATLDARAGRCSSARARRSLPSTSSCSARSRSRAPSPRRCASRRAGSRGVQALGLELGGRSVQVSTNVVDMEATAPHELVEAIVREATRVGAEVGAGELVGLLPAPSWSPLR